ncbi:MAG: hypothetical protein MR519_05670 [Spirochaetaceae bacterium]|nr:hypothetical protein [Spirochaetaceae bacterium]
MSDKNRNLEPYQKIENSILGTYRSRLWGPFIHSVKEYQLIQPGDRIAVCISGGKDSMLMAKLMQLLQRYSLFPFEVVFLVMDPGYNETNRRKIEANAKLLHIPITIFETNIFNLADMAEKYPCYHCARMRRGHLYKKARELGCNKIALGHHLNDVIETVVMGMCYSAEIQCMPPKLHSKNYPGMELIRPLYAVYEHDIVAWARYNGLQFIQCACRVTDGREGETGSKRKETKLLIQQLKKDNPTIEQSLFGAVHNVVVNTFPAYKDRSGRHSFLEKYNEGRETEE